MDHAAPADVALLQEDLIDCMPFVEEANSISEELDKRVKFEIMLISPKMLDGMFHQGEFEERNFKSHQTQVGMSD